MIVTIDIQCEDIGELTSHLYVLIRDIKKHGKKSSLKPTDPIPKELKLEDNNCYGTHELRVSDESDESPSSDPAEVLVKALEECKRLAHDETSQPYEITDTVNAALSQHEQLKQQ